MTEPLGGEQREDPFDEQLASRLQHRYRRWTLWCLAKTDDTLHLADLAQDLAQIESATAEKTPTEDTARSIYIQLYHSHLPKLNEADAISFNSESKLVSLTVDTNLIASKMEKICELSGQNIPR